MKGKTQVAKLMHGGGEEYENSSVMLFIMDQPKMAARAGL